MCSASRQINSRKAHFISVTIACSCRAAWEKTPKKTPASSSRLLVDGPSRLVHIIHRRAVSFSVITVIHVIAAPADNYTHICRIIIWKQLEEANKNVIYFLHYLSPWDRGGRWSFCPSIDVVSFFSAEELLLSAICLESLKRPQISIKVWHNICIFICNWMIFLWWVAVDKNAWLVKSIQFWLHFKYINTSKCCSIHLFFANSSFFIFI